jgi:hypothetical protein
VITDLLQLAPYDFSALLNDRSPISIQAMREGRPEVGRRVPAASATGLRWWKPVNGQSLAASMLRWQLVERLVSPDRHREH